MSERSLLIIVLAAGKGTRMKSAIPKVLHVVAGRTLIGHMLATASKAGGGKFAIVVGPGMDDVATEATAAVPSASVFLQPNQQGTADAVLAARPALEAHKGGVIVLFGDTPLLTPTTIAATVERLNAGTDIAVVGFRAKDPTGYGRILMDRDGSVLAIREHNDASPAEREVNFCNSGVMGFRSENMLALLTAIGNDNAKQEYYLTDAVEIGRARGLQVTAVEATESETQGINDRAQLAAVEAQFQTLARARVMEAGATLIAPETVYLSHDTVIGRDVIIEPFVVFGPGVTVADNVTIRAFTHLVGADRKAKSGAHVGEGAELGPFSRLRPGAILHRDVHVGNFVEVKNAVLEEGAKANHLTYLGDARVGAKANIGAGTITCNYDGFNKHHTDIGAGAFIGSNTALVAPVKVGDGAVIGAGTVVARNVSADSLALTRAPHEERPGWAAKFREMMSRKKKPTPR
jgi:bifunctional UDP-N-acetylglucosamine pyrophosphorylase/glucosamine-1-phosphate N-acetyltransferase